MFRVSYKNITFFFLIKHILFLIFMMLTTHNYNLLDLSNIKTGSDLFFYLWLIFFLPVINILILLAPLYFSFRIKSGFTFLLAILVIFIVEYFIFVYFTSAKHIDVKGVYSAIFTALVFYLFFFRRVNEKINPV